MDPYRPANEEDLPARVGASGGRPLPVTCLACGADLTLRRNDHGRPGARMPSWVGICPKCALRAAVRARERASPGKAGH